MELANVIISGISALVAVVSAIAAAVSALRSRKAKEIAETKRDEAVEAAKSVASSTGRIADVQESRETVEASAQAASVVFVRSVPQRGFSGWKVENYSDQPVTEVAVRSTTGAAIRVYNNDMEQLPEYVEHILGAHQQSHRMFRPTDAEGAQADPAETERMAVRFTDSRGQTWERIGSKSAQRLDS